MSAGGIGTMEPALLWTRFRELAAVPRPPRGEQAALAYVRDWAAGLGLEVVPAGGSNLLVRVPATAAREHASAVVLQAHLDMVCERDPSSSRDPAIDGVRLMRVGDWVAADGTTLGADDGIGVAAMQAVAESDAPHGPLELLFTTAEEVGLEGAGMLDGDVVTGRRLLNLDAEEDGVLVIGCAGATDSTLRIGGERLPAAGSEVALRVLVSGARGGHSGLDIASGTANAIKLLGHCLGKTRTRLAFRLVSLDGGSSRNAIPRDASALLLASDSDAGALATALEEAGLEARGAFASEPDLRVSVQDVPTPADAWSAEATVILVDALQAMPSGPLTLDARFPGQVRTSTSLGVAATKGDVLELRSLTRASDPEAIREVLETLAAVARSAGAEMTVEHGYPPWEPSPDSPLLAACVSVWRDLFGEEPLVTAAHAGLEPALIGLGIAGMDMLSTGPRIESPHSPDERVSIASVRRFWRFLIATLEALSS